MKSIYILSICEMSLVKCMDANSVIMSDTVFEIPKKLDPLHKRILVDLVVAFVEARNCYEMLESLKL